jgi:hypothetical protein
VGVCAEFMLVAPSLHHFLVNETMRVIELTKGYVAIVDDEDFERLAQYRWCYSNGYAVRRRPRELGGGRIFMHLEILGMACFGVNGDHKNLNRLDNRRLNLRPATDSQNQHNRSKYRNNTTGFKGVTRCQGKFQARITVKGEQIFLGYYKTAEEAHAAYCLAAAEHHKQFARFN